MECPNCHQPVEPGATFCGNCGQQIMAAAAPMMGAAPVVGGTPPVAAAPAQQPGVPGSPIAQVYNNQPVGLPGTAQPYGPPIAAVPGAGMPAYAIPGTHPSHTKAILAVVFGPIGIIGGLFIPLIGLVLGITGIILGTMAPKTAGKGLKVTGIVLSSLAVVAGLANWVYIIANDPTLKSHSTSSSNSSLASSTPTTISNACYSIDFSKAYNIDNTSTGCDMTVYNGTTSAGSSNVFTVVSAQESTVTDSNFMGIAKQALESEVKSNLPDYAVTDERAGTFSGSPAYFIDVAKASSHLSAEEVAVFHNTGEGDNLFILVHATTDSSADVSDMENGWQWK